MLHLRIEFRLIGLQSGMVSPYTWFRVTTSRHSQPCFTDHRKGSNFKHCNNLVPSLNPTNIRTELPMALIRPLPNCHAISTPPHVQSAKLDTNWTLWRRLMKKEWLKIAPSSITGQDTTSVWLVRQDSSWAKGIVRCLVSTRH